MSSDVPDWAALRLLNFFTVLFFCLFNLLFKELLEPKDAELEPLFLYSESYMSSLRLDVEASALNELVSLSIAAFFLFLTKSSDIIFIFLSGSI